MTKETFIEKKISYSDIEINCKGKTLGRVASSAVKFLRGKDSPAFKPNKIPARKVILYNIKDIIISGRKDKQKVYYRHSGYPGGLKEIKYEEIFRRHPEFVVRQAIYGMLPANKLRKYILRNLQLYAGEKQEENAQGKKD